MLRSWRHSILVALILSCSLLSSCGGSTGSGNSGYSSAGSGANLSEGGLRSQYGTIAIVELSGSYEQMGRQYGRLLRKELQAFYALAIEDFFIGQKGYRFERLKTITWALFDQYPAQYQDFFRGMAETSGLTMDQVLILNAIELIPMLNHATPGGRCCGIAVWGDYTSDGQLFFGRNNEDPGLPKGFARYLVVTVLKPEQAETQTALINYAGVFYCATGMNNHGVFLEINSGPWGGYEADRIPSTVALYDFLQNSSSQADLGERLLSLGASLNLIVNVADAGGACSYECSFDGGLPRQPEAEGFLASTNHFLNPAWGITPQEDAGKTIERYNNLVAYGTGHKGQFDADLLMQLLDTPVEEGGATLTDSILFQVIAAPSQPGLWIKIPAAQDWTPIPLEQFFSLPGTNTGRSRT